jgi:hypothetical protein
MMTIVTVRVFHSKRKGKGRRANLLIGFWIVDSISVGLKRVLEQRSLNQIKKNSRKNLIPMRSYEGEVETSLLMDKERIQSYLQR